MTNLTLKQKIIAAVIAIGIALIAIFNMGLGGKSKPTLPPEPVANNTAQIVKSSDDIKIVSTSPSGLKEKSVIILPTQIIEITFNQPLVNPPETKLILDPPVEFRVELSDDKKTAKIIPKKPFTLGQGYTIFVKGNTKFDGGLEFGKDADFHFTTISYNGV